MGSALGQVLDRSSYMVQYIDPAHCLGIERLVALPKETTRVLHICFRLDDHKAFAETITDYALAIEHDVLVVHSTVLPGSLDGILGFDYVYSPIRGQHNNLAVDIKRYTKYLASENPDMLELAGNRFLAAGIAIHKCNNNIVTLEWTKHLANTLYYHWMIGYRQLVHQWCKDLNLDEGILWSFTKELYEHTGIQYPSYYDTKGVQGHCVLQNSKLLKQLHDKPDSMDAVLRLLLLVNDRTVNEKVKP